jgi:hypothetical protein
MSFIVSLNVRRWDMVGLRLRQKTPAWRAFIFGHLILAKLGHLKNANTQHATYSTHHGTYVKRRIDALQRNS